MMFDNSYNCMEKKTVLVLTNCIAGIHSFRKEVMKALVDNGYDVVISHPDIDERCAYFANIGCKDELTEFDRRGMNPVQDMMLMLKYRRLIRKYRPVAVLTYTIKPNVYGGMACRLTGTPQLANVTGLGDAIENGGLLQKLTIFLYNMGLGKARRVFFQNKYNRQFCISKHIADESSVLLPGSGVNLDHHKYQDYPADGVIKFLFITRLLRDKGTEEFFEAAQRIKTKYPNTEFQILGTCEGNYQQKLDSLVADGIINFLGETTDVRPFVGAVHCTVMPSYHEGMSNVNLESAANGRPVITTNVPGCQETVDDGVTGILCEAKSADSLVAAIEKFMGLSYEEKKTMGQAARRKVEREFDRQMVVNAYLQAVEGVAE